jgi:hypothetical protein
MTMELTNILWRKTITPVNQREETGATVIYVTEEPNCVLTWYQHDQVGMLLIDAVQTHRKHGAIENAVLLCRKDAADIHEHALKVGIEC